MIDYFAMHWLHSIPFNKSSSMRSSSTSNSSSSVAYDDMYVATTSKKRDHHRHRTSGFICARGWFGIHAQNSSRERKLRQLSDQGSVFESLAAPLPSPTLSTAASVPLPLPLPMPECGGGGGDSRFPLPKENIAEERVRGEERDRALTSTNERVRGEEKDRALTSTNERVRGEEKDRTSTSTNVAIKSVFSAREPRRSMVYTGTTSGNVRQYLNDAGPSQDDYALDCPNRSAPTSLFGSPILSPQRSSTADLFPYYHMPPNGNGQAWSAPEMAAYDFAGLPPPAFFDFTAFSTESSPLHSPNRSPRGTSKSPSRPASPLHMKLSPETPTIRRESNGVHPNGQRESISHVNSHREMYGAPLNTHRENSSHINVHPLPLPPGAATPAQAAPVSQVTPKSDVVPRSNQWQKGKLIGRGTFGSVYVASNRETGALCAMKEVEMFPDDPKSAECIKQLEQEIKVLSQLKHPNIVQYYGSEIIDDKFNIYLEYVHPGSINKYIRDHCGAMTESIIRNFTRHILSGLAYWHSTKTVHRDIKGANLLVDAFGVVKLADFGMAKHLTGQRADLSLKGSPYWMAPELMQAVMQKDNSSDLAFAIDIWSLGCTIIEMFDGKPPWSEYEGAAAMFKVMKDTPPVPETLSPEGKDFLRCCFQRNPAERPTASMLLEHRFVKGSLVPSDSPCREALNAMKLTEKPRSPRRRDIKLDQLPVPMSRSAKKVIPDR